MVIGDSIDRAEICQVIFVGSIIAVPGNHIEGRKLLLSFKKLAIKLNNHSVAVFSVLESSNRALKVSRIRQAIGSCSK